MRLEIHPTTPQPRLMRLVVEVFQRDGLVIAPLDSGYAVACRVDSRKAMGRMYQLRGARQKRRFMTLVVPDFGRITDFARVDNRAFRQMKQALPGPYTFILPAASKARRLLEVNRPEVGIRMPESRFLGALYGIDPNLVLLTTSARGSDEEFIQDPEEIEARFANQVEIIADMGPVPVTPTTVISLVSGEPEVIREGAGPVG